MAESNQEQKINVHKAKRERSPSYPSIDLETALEKAKIVLQKEGRHYAPVSVICKDWGYTENSSNGSLILAALLKFGLMEDKGQSTQREAKISEIARKIILDERPDSQERFEAIQAVALKPAIHAQLWQEYGGSLPSDDHIRFKLTNTLHFTKNAADQFIKQFKKTIEFANLEDSDRLLAEGEDKLPPELIGEEPMNAPPPSIGNQMKPSSISPSILSYNLPVSGGTRITLQLPGLLNKRQWKEMLSILQAMKPGLVEFNENEVEPDEVERKLLAGME